MKKVLLTLTMLLFAFTGVMRASAEQGNVRADQVIEQGFEDGMGDWTMNHCHSSSGPTSSYGGNTGNYAFRFYYTTNYPQYLISPELDDNDGVNFTFYAARYSSNYPETFKVGYSSTTNEPTEFTWGSEVTCTTMYGAGAYQEYSYDFPAGTKYVSIACTSNDQFYMFVDDITVTATEPAPGPTPGGLVEVTIGDPTSTTTNSYLPGYTLYDYAISQQIYTADEIGVAGTINTLTMWLKNSSSYARNINVYMKETEASVFASTSAWESFTASDMVASFTMPNANSTPIEVAIDLSTPFEYSGNDNLVICFQDVTGQWSSGLGGVVMDASGNQAIYAYRDGTVYDPSNPGVNGTLLAKKNVVKLAIMTGGTPVPAVVDVITDPAELNIGYRPIGYWMEPYTFNFYTVEAGTTATITSVINGSNAFMPVTLETPATINDTVGAVATVTSGTADPGEVTEEFAIDFNGRGLKSFQITGTAYEPVEGDVWELAIEDVDIPFSGNAPAGIYKNYNIENSAPDAADVVYKVTFENEVLLSAGTNSANGVARLYTENFSGKPGPMVDNHYEFTAGGGYPPMETWFSEYEYTNGNTFFGTSAGGGMIFGYKIPAEYLAGYGHCYLDTVEAAAREAYPYDLYVLRGGTSPADAELVYSQEMSEPATAQYFFDMAINEPFAIGEDEDLWVMFYSESPYAAYCGKQPVDTENGKIWYTLDGTTWYSNVAYTPVIRLHLEYPNPADRGGVVLNLADMSIKPFNNNGTVAEAEGRVNMPVHQSVPAPQQRDGNPLIYQAFIPAGTYYLAVASTEEQFDVYIETEEVPAPEQAAIITPEDGALGVNNGDPFQWTLGQYTTEFQIILGTQFPPTTVYLDWTSELFESMQFSGLQHNKTYFVQINERNSTGTTYGEITGFTTVIDGVTGFAAESEDLYPGEAAVFTWDANARSLQGYNLYKDGVLVNEAPITETTYTVEGLTYNMDGYSFTISALYDEGESEQSDPVVVRMTGNGKVKGKVYQQNGTTKVPDATVIIRGYDQYGSAQEFTTTTNASGSYNVDVLAGTGYRAYAYKNGFQEGVGEDVFNLDYQQTLTGINVLLYEEYIPLGMITATLQEAQNRVRVEWDWAPEELFVDFETGDFSQADFVLPATYPWAITTTNPYEGTYCMKSTCEGVASASSSIEAVVEVPFEAKMSFWVKVSSENNYDKFHFYIDGVEQGSALSGAQDYAFKEYNVSEGTHTYKWEYTKDSSVNSNDDCVYVDNITMYREYVPAPPVPGATTYNFDDGTMMNWTSLDADGDGNGWVSSSNPGIYHNSGVSLSGTGNNASEAYVISGSYANQTGQALTPDNYLIAPTQINAASSAQINFWACAQDASYAAEHFGVAVSTTTATAGAFTTIQEWTMTAKGPQGNTAENVRNTRGLRQGNWYQFTADLSAYAGQTIWVAIRHFNCTDMFILNVDDITVADGSAKREITDGERKLNHFNLYRRDINVPAGEEPEAELIAEVSKNRYYYNDNEWPNLTYGQYQWGIQAYYAGNREDRSELTVYDGTDGNGYVPVYGFYADAYLRCQYVIPAIDLAEMSGKAISQLTYYLSSPASAAWTATFQVYLLEIPGTTITSFVDPSIATTVYTGTLNAAGPNMVVTFDTPYTYNGGNLLIGFDETTTGNYTSATFAGTNVDNASVQGYSYTSLSAVSPTQRNFIPKTTFTYEGNGGGSTGGYNGLSEILWSNVIEKDMYADVTVNVSLNNGQAPVGVNVAFGENTMTTDENGVAFFEALPKGEYDLEVSMPEFTTYTEHVVIDQNVMEFNVTLNENVGPVEGLYVSPTGWAMWTGATPSGPVTPVTPVTPGGTWSDDFEDGALTNWTTIDADGDGDTWVNATPALYDIGDAHSGTNCASSWSWNNYSMDPDNYMISPMKENATSIQYFVATNTGYPDHYGIFASSTGTSASDFTLVFEETAGSKGNAGVKSSMTQAGTRDMSSWIERNVNLPAGTKYVAFRHYNSYDMNYLFIDDVTITMGGSKGNRAALSYKVKLDGQYVGETRYAYYQHDVEGFEEGSEHTTSVAAIYATGMGDWVDYTWTYTPCDNYTGATNVTAEQQGSTMKIDWTMPSGGGVTPTPPPTGGWTEDFEGGAIPTGWATIDADGDGNNWVLASATMGTGYGHNGSNDLILSQSYSNTSGPLTPNNYLVTPQVTPTAGSTFSFFACAQDASWAAEHFGVAISTNSQTNANDFTMLQEWTMTAKDGGIAAPGRDGGMRTQGNWYEYSVDLSSYVGQSVYLAIRHFNCTDYFYLDVDDVTFTAAAKDDRAMWDLVYEFDGTSGYQYGVATDGNNIYTSSWSASSTSMFYKYDMQGNFIEEFNISGCGQLRGMTYDGEYFYGVANSSTIYCVDLANHALIGSTTSAYGAMRCITYDPVRDGFWVVGNWSGNLTLVSRTGAIVQAGGAPSSAADCAYYKDVNDIEHVLLFCQPSGQGSAEVYDYDIAANTISSTPLFDVAASLGGIGTGSAGGCFVGTYDNKTCFFADVQASPQHIAIYELDASGTPGPGPGPGPGPQPSGDILGAYVFLNGELVSGIDPITTGTFTHNTPDAGEYCVRVVYSDYSMSCGECATSNYTCVPVNNLSATYTYNSIEEYGVTLAWECAQAEYVQTYDIYFNDTILAQVTDLSYFVDMTENPGEYTFGVVANYGFCESEMMTATVSVTGVDELMGNVMVYPNPTNSNVTIVANRMNHITVANALGQIVYDADVDADMFQMNLGQFNAGLYLVRISTEYGVSVKRVTVVQ